MYEEWVGCAKIADVPQARTAIDEWGIVVSLTEDHAGRTDYGTPVQSCS